ncbi:MAG: 2OG-Fe(II) oxygenase [Pseudomonadota bacterium]
MQSVALTAATHRRDSTAAMNAEHLTRLRHDAVNGNPFAERLLLLHWLQSDQPDAIETYLDDRNNATHRSYVIAELTCFHGWPSSSSWPDLLQECAEKGHSEAGQVVRLYHDWARHSGQLPVDHDNYDCSDPNWHAWQPPAWTTAAYGNDVSVETSAAFIPRSLIAYVRALLSPQLKPSVVVDPETGQAIAHPVRINRAAQWFPEALGWIGKLFECRLAITGGYAVENAEVSSLLHYTPGQRYKAHYDCIPLKQLEAENGNEQGGQRTQTLLLALGDDRYQGGETAFPHLGARVRTQVGELMRFNNTDKTGEPNRASLHEGTPVTAGEKWLLSKWVREAPTPYGRELNLRCDATS